MPSRILTREKFDKRLAKAIRTTDALAARHPGDPAFAEIRDQLRAVSDWTGGGRPPTQAQKDSLDFGLLASRSVDDVDPELAQRLYDLASYVTYW